MSFDNSGKRKVSLEPRVEHTIDLNTAKPKTKDSTTPKSETAAQTPVPAADINEASDIVGIDDISNYDSENKKHIFMLFIVH